MSGSRILGSAAPELDSLDEKQREKLKHLEALADKGFDVEVLREKIIRGDKDDK